MTVLAHKPVFVDYILVVEDDAKISRILKEALEDDGFSVIEASDGESMCQKLETCDVSAIILDIGLPGRSGLEVARDLQKVCDTPILFVTGRSSDLDRIVGLEVGADDYISKPFNTREVVARVRAVLRRYHASRTKNKRSVYCANSIRIGNFTVNRNTRILTGPNGDQNSLTTAEYILLEYLYNNAGKVCTRDEITCAIKGHEWSPFDRSLDTLIARLRKKIGSEAMHPKQLVTIRGAGYRLNVD